MNANDKIAYTVPEAMAAIGIGRTFLYRLASEGKIDLRMVGGRTLVTAASLRRLVEAAPTAKRKSNGGRGRHDSKQAGITTTMPWPPIDLR